MAQKYVVFEWHTRTNSSSDWGSNDDYVVLPITHKDAVLKLQELDADGKPTGLLHRDFGARTLVQSTPPSNPTVGMTWWDSASGILKTWYRDADGDAYWVDASPTRASRVAESVIDQNVNGTIPLKLWSGTQAELAAIDEALDEQGQPIGRDPNTIYLVEEDEAEA